MSDATLAFEGRITAAARTIRKSEPMLLVRDMRATVRWYQSMGFTVKDTYESGSELAFARVTLGDGTFVLSPGTESGPRDVRLWFYTDAVQELYDLFKERQRRAEAALSPDESEVRFEEELYEPFYGGQQFSIRDKNGVHLIFWQRKTK